MSEEGFEVHGPHDHALEHPGHGASSTNQIAMFTAIIATVGALFGYMGGATQANAGLYKNNAAIKKTEAANQWNYTSQRALNKTYQSFPWSWRQREKMFMQQK